MEEEDTGQVQCNVGHVEHETVQSKHPHCQSEINIKGVSMKKYSTI